MGSAPQKPRDVLSLAFGLATTSLPKKVARTSAIPAASRRKLHQSMERRGKSRCLIAAVWPLSPLQPGRVPHVSADRQEHQAHLPRLHRQDGNLSFRTGDRVWDQVGWRRLARKGRDDAFQTCRSSTRSRRRGPRPAPTPGSSMCRKFVGGLWTSG